MKFVNTSPYLVGPRPFLLPPLPKPLASEVAEAKKTVRKTYGGKEVVGASLVFVVCAIGIGPVSGTMITVAAAVAYDYLRRAHQVKCISQPRLNEERRLIEIERQAIVDEANALTNRLNGIFRAVPHSLPLLAGSISSTQSALDRAEFEFQSNAFSPFWDAIEQAANCMVEFNEITRRNTENFTLYYQALRGREHNFPRLPVSVSAFPDPTNVLSRLQAIVRMAQCDFHFATIYEQRKTNNILKHGFMSLNSAVADLGNTISHTIGEFKQAMDDHMEVLIDVVEETRSAIEKAADSASMAANAQLAEIQRGNEAAAKVAIAQERRDNERAEMLDNIQRHRIPEDSKRKK